MTTNPLAAYRRAAVEGASPEQLIGLLYEGATAALQCAARAAAEGQIEARVRGVNRALAINAELRASLDIELGGRVARTLARFYEIAKGRMLEASLRQSAPMLAELAGQFQGLREAWRQVERDQRSQPTPGARSGAPADEAVGAQWSA